jgi:hypothetical protein
MRASRRWCLTATILACILASNPASAADPFSLVSSTNIGSQCHGLASDGTDWYVANFGDPIRVFDVAWVQIGTLTVPGGRTIRGLAFDIASGNLFLGSYGTQEVVETTTAGVQVNVFPTGLASGFNAVAVNDIDGTVWVVGYGGDIRHLTRTGSFLGGFSTPFNWTGAAVDALRNTILLMESSPDTVHEYDFGGATLGLAIASDCVGGNGQGLTYDSFTGVLTATGQYGDLSIWDRPIPISPPTCTLTGPAGSIRGDVLLDLVSDSPAGSATVDVTFDYSEDGGLTWFPCTPAPTSALGSNPALGVPVGPASFTWDTETDGVGVLAPVFGVMCRATIDDGMYPGTVDCQSASFEVDNSGPVTLCGDCDGNGVLGITDALVAAQISAGVLPPPAFGTAQFNDCNVQGLVFPDPSAAITILDALELAQSVAGLLTVSCC